VVIDLLNPSEFGYCQSEVPDFQRRDQRSVIVFWRVHAGTHFVGDHQVSRVPREHGAGFVNRAVEPGIVIFLS